MSWWDSPHIGAATGSSGSTSAGGGSGSISGSVYDYSTTYGGKPNVPDPSTSAATAVTGNVNNLSSILGMASNINDFSASEANKTQEELTPGYSGNMAQWSQNISDLLSGKISSGAINTMETTAAESGISTGLAGSQTNQSQLLRALGLTSERLQATGASQLASQVATSPKVSAFDITPYLTTASDQQAAQYAANTNAAAANPAAAASAALNAASSGLTAGSNAAGTVSPSSGGGSGNQSIASLLSSILGTGSGGSGTITANSLGTGGSGITQALNSILGTGNTGIAGSDSNSGDVEDYTGQNNFSDTSLGNEQYQGDTGGYDYYG